MNSGLKAILEAIRSDGWRSSGKAIKGKNVSHYKVSLTAS